jgi:serine/threonine-protein kinase HipA
MRRAKVFYSDLMAGVLEEASSGYRFTYDQKYLNNTKARPISFSFPLQRESFESEKLFSFFEGLIPEGWYLEIVTRTLKADPEDRFGLLLATAAHTIGAVSILPEEISQGRA